MKFKIVLLTSGQPSLNPRLVKEADALTNAGFEVTVLYAYWNGWGTEMDKQLLLSKPWRAIRVGGSPQQSRFIYLLSRIINKVAVMVTQRFNVGFMFNLAIARSSFFLLRAAKKYPAHLYIGHNLGALPGVVKAANYHKVPCGFDAEDLHRFETSDTGYNFKLKSYIEDKYFKDLTYLSASSRQISKAYQQLFPGMKPLTLLNVPAKNKLIKAPGRKPGEKIRLFWFSQSIGKNRGIEDVVSALKLLHAPDFELHLLGYLPADIKTYFDDLNAGMVDVTYHSPITPDELPAFASRFDIGLALEPAFSRNNDLALSNKIFTYLQAGLAVIASDTTAQKSLVENYPEIGVVYQKGNIEMLSRLIGNYQTDRDLLVKTRRAAYETADTELNWDVESERFIDQIKSILAV